MINKKQILVIALVLVIIAAGILQYTYGDTGFSSQREPEERLGEAVYVNNMDGDSIGLTTQQTDKIAELDTTGEQVVTASAGDYFVQARMDRESIRSRQKEELQDLTNGEEQSGAVSEKAQEEYLDLIKRSEIEATIESLVKQRGIEDVVVIFGSTGSVDIVVKADSLSQSQTAQISDIVIRHAGVEMKDIYIKNMN
jgi:stage III sporulation protein AH